MLKNNDVKLSYIYILKQRNGVNKRDDIILGTKNLNNMTLKKKTLNLWCGWTMLITKSFKSELSINSLNI